jgi:hypothetical protein
MLFYSCHILSWAAARTRHVSQAGSCNNHETEVMGVSAASTLKQGHVTEGSKGFASLGGWRNQLSASLSASSWAGEEAVHWDARLQGWSRGISTRTSRAPHHLPKVPA